MCASAGRQQVVDPQVAPLRPRPAPRVAHDLLDHGARGAREPLRRLRQVRAGKRVAQVVPQDALARLQVGQGNGDVPVQAAGTPDRGIDPVGMVGRADDDHALAPLGAVEALEEAR